MSDKKPTEQTKADNNTAAADNYVEYEADLSASSNISSPLTASSNKLATADDSEKYADKAENIIKAKTKATAAQSTNQTQSPSNKKHDKSTAPLKNNTSSTSSKSTTAGTATLAEKNTATHTKLSTQTISKTAMVALIIALLAIGTSAGHYYWSEQQKVQYSLQLNELVKRQLDDNQQQIAQQLLNNKQRIAQQLLQSKQASTTELNALRKNLEEVDSLTKSDSDTLAKLQQQVASLGNNQPSDWLLQEAEYLIRVASRSLWLEKETSTAISLLNDADLRIKQLNDPQFFSLRQVIQQDIARLVLLPTLTIDNAILKLMTLSQQTQQLPLTKTNASVKNDQEIDVELSENASDWRENLTKTWYNIAAKFLTISKKTVDAKPLMSPDFTQNLRENLNLKLQTAIWAASKMNQEVYQQALNQSDNWLKDYFDMTDIGNQNFSNIILKLQNEVISAEYPNRLDSLAAVRQLLANKKQIVIPSKVKSSAAKVLKETVTEPVDVARQEGA
ncbi:MAG: uroporphyrin-3 C-methyltransferase [Cognaticolwellia sp.]|jgi:uroporphyrin-3 C-methyltransferase